MLRLDETPKNSNFWTLEDENEGLKRMMKKFSLLSKAQKASKNQA
ncbi:MAG: hypothetical protein ACKVOU_07110 [Cytophagales bacterium]